MIKEFDELVAKDEEEVDDNVLQEVPDYENEFVRAKTFLQTNSGVTGDNLYDHLTDVLNKILAERPENVIDFFEEYSRKVKEKRFKPLTDHLEDLYVSPARYALSKKWLPFLAPMMPDEPSTMDPDDVEIARVEDMLQLLHYFEQAGVGLPKQEIFTIMLTMMRLIKREPLVSIRFWGKIYGVFKNYLVLETELKEEEYARAREAAERARDEEIRLQEEAKAVDAATQAALAAQEIPGEPNTTGIPRPLPAPPKILFEEPPEPPNELPGLGVNRKVFFICSEAGDDWIRLPDVTAKQIRVARLIRKSFTGNLEQPINTYPEFPGTEINYLRAQIARISAGTQISPLGYYTFSEEGGEDEEEEEEEVTREGRTSYKENTRFEGVPIRDMIDGSMSFWVHHTLYILPQGRTTWWNPMPGGDIIGGEEEMGEEEEEKGHPIGPEPETGPPLLTPLSEDSSLEAIPPWSVRLSSPLTKEFSIAVVRSNIWPGAFCFANQGKIFQNIYFGDGLKYLAQNFSPRPLPPVEQDYPIGPEVMEIDDPTGAEEEAWRIAHLPKLKVPRAEVAGEEEEPEDDEDDDEEDDDD